MGPFLRRARCSGSVAGVRPHEASRLEADASVVAPDTYLTTSRKQLRYNANQAMPAPVIGDGRFGRLASEARSEHHVSMLGRRREPAPELPLDRGDVMAIIGGLADIRADTQAILEILEEEEDGEEEEDEL